MNKEKKILPMHHNYLSGHNQKRSLPLYDVHPISVRLLKSGHPWILKDKFTENFRPRDKFIVAKERRKPLALLIHDPRHKHIKARVWSYQGDFNKHIKNFKNDLQARIHKAVKKRKELKIAAHRENFYLTFGEADLLPGIKVVLLKDQVVIQFYSYFWENYKDFIIQAVLKSVNGIFNLELSKIDVWTQFRVDSEGEKKGPVSLDPNCSYKLMEVSEFGVKYEIKLGKNYDFGIYTDMSCIRSFLNKTFNASKSVLNLYAYTGAFSLYSLKSGAKEVVSVDLSENYIDELEKNLELNDFDKKDHQSLIQSVDDSLDKLIVQQKTFDLIISDPPSSSSDGQKRTNALKEYEKMLPKMAQILKAKGKILVFLNTHKINKNKFKQKISQIIKENDLKLKISMSLRQGQDCPELKGFPEGSYLKGLLLTHHDQS